MTPQKNNRLIYLDVLNIIAIIAVLFLHHNMLSLSYSDSRAWLSSHFIKALFYFAVPLFLMNTGVTLLNYRQKYDTKTYFKKRVSKIIIPLVFWSVFMVFWGCVVTGDLKITDWSIRNLFNIFESCRENTIYYFIFCIIGVYLTIPILTPLTEKKNRKLLWYFVAIFFFFNTLLPDILSLFKIYLNKYATLQIGEWIFYPVLGYLLNTAKIQKSRRVVLYVLGAASVAYHFFIVYFLSKVSGHLVDSASDYFQFHVILLASSVFVFVKNLPLDKLSDKLKTILSRLASCSFGIYLIHIPIIWIETKILDIPTPRPLYYRVFFPIITYIASAVIVLILKSIPLIKRIVP